VARTVPQKKNWQSNNVRKKNKHYRHKSKNEIPNQKKANFKQNKKNVEIPRRVKPKKKQLRDTPQNKKKLFIAFSGSVG